MQGTPSSQMEKMSKHSRILAPINRALRNKTRGDSKEEETQEEIATHSRKHTARRQSRLRLGLLLEARNFRRDCSQKIRSERKFLNILWVTQLDWPAPALSHPCITHASAAIPFRAPRVAAGKYPIPWACSDYKETELSPALYAPTYKFIMNFCLKEVIF